TRAAEEEARGGGGLPTETAAAVSATADRAGDGERRGRETGRAGDDHRPVPGRSNRRRGDVRAGTVRCGRDDRGAPGRLRRAGDRRRGSRTRGWWLRGPAPIQRR